MIRSARAVSAPTIAAGIAAATLILFLGLPAIWLVLRAVLDGSVIQAVADPAVIQALLLSLLTTAISLVIIVVLGTPLAFNLARGRMPAGSVAEVLIDLPMVLPPAVAGLALLLILGRASPAGQLLSSIGLSVAFSTAAVVLAQVFVAAPFYVRAARVGFAAVPSVQEDAARDLGAPPWRVFRHVSLPLAMPSVLSGMAAAWSRSLGEFGATIMFAGNVQGRTQTLPLAVYSEFQSSLSASVAAATILVLAAASVLIALRLRRLSLSV